MRFDTKLWRRSEKSFATTIPQAILFLLDPDKKYNVEWTYDLKNKIWAVDFIEADKKSSSRFLTSLWKRSQKSFATTIPQAVLLHIDEDKENNVEWEFNKKIQKWVITVTGEKE
jgi:hypothetical protein